MRPRYVMGSSGWSYGVPILMLVLPLISLAFQREPSFLLMAIGMFVAPALAFILMALGTSLSFEIGTDGFTTKRAAGRAHFVPYESVESVRLDGGLVVRRHDGQETIYNGFGNLFTGRLRDRGSMDEVIRKELVDALAAYVKRTEEDSPPDADALHREALRALLNENDVSASTYREAAPTNSAMLDRVLADPHTDDATRAAAAALMRVQDPERARVRIAAAADETVSPRMRAMLEAVADEDVENARLAEELAKLKSQRT